MSILHCPFPTAPLARPFRTAAARAVAPSARPCPLVFRTDDRPRPDRLDRWARWGITVLERFGGHTLAGASLGTGER